MQKVRMDGGQYIISQHQVRIFGSFYQSGNKIDKHISKLNRAQRYCYSSGGK